MMHEVRTISETAAFFALAAEWNALANRFATPLLRHEWFAACLEAFGSRQELSIFVAREGNRIRAIAPLAIDRSGLTRRLVLIGAETHEPSGFIYDDAAALGAVCDAIIACGLPFSLPRLGIDSEEMRQLRLRSRSRGFLIERSTPIASSWVPLASGWAGLEAAMKSDERSKLRRLRRFAEREGAVVLEIVSPDESSVEGHLRDVFEVESSGWKQKAGTGILADERMRAFVTTYGRMAAKAGTLRIFYMRIGAATVAVQMAVEFGGRLWYIKQGYDERFAKCAPGITLTHETLRYACERKLEACEFLGQAEAWQRRWPIALQQYTSTRFYPTSLTGGLALCADAWRQRPTNVLARVQRLLPKAAKPDLAKAAKPDLEPAR